MICKKIVSIMFEFWWSTKRETNSIYWKIWNQLNKNKGKGGLGFRDLEALLGKQLWRLLTKKDSLLARVLKSRYYVKSNPLNASFGSRPSYAWRSIHSAQGLMKQCARVLIGNREDGFKGVARSLD